MTAAITRIGLGGVNCYLLKAGDGFVLVDTGLASKRDDLDERLAHAGCVADRLRLIVLTHGDLDHAGNAVWLRDRLHTQIAVHPDDAGMVTTGDTDWGRKPRPDRMTMAGRVIRVSGSLLELSRRGQALETFEPDLYVEDGFDLSEYGPDARVLHLPGHSRGSIGVLTNAGDLCCGDLLYNWRKPSVPICDDAAAWEASIDKLRGLHVVTVYPGHGKPFPWSAVLEWQQSNEQASLQLDQGWIDVLRCPMDGAAVRWDGGVLRCTGAGRHVVSANDGILSLLPAGETAGKDARWNAFYDRLAPFYDWNERAGGRVFGVNALEERRAIVDRLGLQAGMRVLEVSPGPGVYQGLLFERIGPMGRLAELDLSAGMLRQCARRARQRGADPLLVQGNGSQLPFADDAFDAVFHFGGVKLFSEPERALAEFVRVARPGATVAWGDEGFGEGAPTGWRRRALERMNPGFLEPQPPLPAGIDDAVTYEVMNGCAWFVVAHKVTTDG